MIEARELTKRFGQVMAVDELTFSPRLGEVTGFLGHNGSGKESVTKRGRRGRSALAVTPAEVEQLGYLGNGFGPWLDVAHGGAGVAIPGLSHLACDEDRCRILNARRIGRCWGVVLRPAPEQLTVG